jgi:hypothetical protein
MPTPTTDADEYEVQVMNAGEALARERVRMAGWAHAVFAILAARTIYLAVTAQGYWAPLLVFAIWLFFSTLRTVVTPRHLHVQLGIWGPRIPIEDIVDAKAIDGSSFMTLGWGIRYSFAGGVTYSVPAFGRRYLLVEYRRGGHRRFVRVMSEDPERLVRAIARARAIGSALEHTEHPLRCEALTPEGEDGEVEDNESTDADEQVMRRK